MPASYLGLLSKSFVILLAVLAGIATSLFIILHFSPLSQIDKSMGLALFITVTCLLVAGYALGFIALAFFGIFVFTGFSGHDFRQ